jgi:hypothetical protein
MGAVCVMLMGLAGCTGGKDNASAPTLKPPRGTERRAGAESAPPPGERSQPKSRQQQQPQPEERKKLLGIIPLGERAPGYGWDGQHSTGTVKANMDSVLACGVQALRNLGFVLKNEECKRETATLARMMGVKSDQTTAWLWVEEKTPGVLTLKAKVGGLGDRNSSERVLDETQKVLLNPPAPKKKAP